MIAREVRPFVAHLRGEMLSSVVFVMDCLQLVFDRCSLNLDVWPTVCTGTSTVCFGDSGYRDALCGFIGGDVVDATESHATGIVLRFAAGAITVNPGRDEVVGPEIAMLIVGARAGEPMEWVVWRPGEGVFDRL